MKKLYKYLALTPLFLGMSSGLTSCSNGATADRFTLKIINSEDYIYLDDENPRNNMVEQFKRYVKQLAKDGEIDRKFMNIDVVYDTSDTNETLYSELQTGKSDYDLINVSDYMAQKMVTEELVVPLYREGEDRSEVIPNYEQYGSKVLVGKLDNIAAPNKNKKITEVKYLKDYAVGYMWGTLGILFNPDYYSFEVDEVLNDMHYSYSALWNKKYNKTISIKNSMRDTFAAGMMHAYEDDFVELKRQLDEGEIDEAEFNEKYTLLFNGEIDAYGNELKFPKVVDKVHSALNTLKKNIFGLEVDSGKQDIVTKKIGVNLAWSGDAVYSMDQAEDEELVGKNTSELYYCVPETGSNLWFDTWVMPKNANRSEERHDLALMFLDFMSDPANAMQNMDYTGYTSFIGGGEVLELARDWYDMRTDEMYEEVDGEYYQIYAVNPGEGTDVKAIDYDDCMTFDSSKGEQGRGHLSSLDLYPLYYYVSDDEEHVPTKAEILAQNHIVYKVEDEETTDVQKTYGDLLIVDADDEYKVDLSYFFNDTLEGSGYLNNYDTVFYSDCYYADPFAEDEEHPHMFYHTLEDGTVVYHENNSVGRQFFTQYPDEEVINRCAVMKDFGENNKLVMKMWEEFKSDPLPMGGIIIFVIIIASGVALAGLIIINKVLTNKIRKKRKKAQKQWCSELT